jgi:hypothetical protein
MNKSLRGVARRVAGTAAVTGAMRRLIRLFVKLNPGLAHEAAARQVADRMQFSLAVSKEIEGLLDGIPSETSSRERRFLYNFFATIWNGDGDVIEIGPFLGGTTRAIALGMDANPRGAKDAKLYTYDRFHGYYDLSRLVEYLSPLIEKGVVSRSDLEATGESTGFMDIFTKIHAGHAYCGRILPLNQAAPDRPEDLEGGAQYLRIPEEVTASAVFVDGCKSWYGTKYFMKAVRKAVKPGAYFILQDYGWYTCFWVSAFLELLEDHFRLIGFVDTTYAFVLTKALDEKTIEERFPDTPAELGEERVCAIFDRLIAKAAERRDDDAAIRHGLHCAGALATLGNKTKARETIAALRRHPAAGAHQRIIDAAARRPTYGPDGVVSLEAGE